MRIAAGLGTIILSLMGLVPGPPSAVTTRGIEAERLSPLFARTLADSLESMEGKPIPPPQPAAPERKDVVIAQETMGAPTCAATCGETCAETCQGDTCAATCGATCAQTCPGTPTCIPTCAETCAETCQGDTCAATCGATCAQTCPGTPTCIPTCAETCAETCQGETCAATCQATCAQTCPGTPTCVATCGVTCPDTTCTETCTPWLTCPGAPNCPEATVNEVTCHHEITCQSWGLTWCMQTCVQNPCGLGSTSSEQAPSRSPEASRGLLAGLRCVLSGIVG